VADAEADAEAVEVEEVVAADVEADAVLPRMKVEVPTSSGD
jgi:hypothetical protein